MINLDVSLVSKNTLKRDIAATPEMRLLAPAEEKTYLDVIKCGSDIYKAASTQDILFVSNLSVISKSACLVSSGTGRKLFSSR